MDKELSDYRLTSANSINVGRLLPQSVYYIYVWSRLIENLKGKLYFSVPSGNFGNLMGGLIARNMGLSNCGFIVSANSNDEVPRYLATGKYEAVVPSRNCISSAMNVGHPSNLPRIISIYGGMMDEKGKILREPDLVKMRADLSAWSITDEDTRATMKYIYDKYRTLLEPHGAVAWKGSELHKKYSGKTGDTYVSLSTAHPAKFAEEVKEACGIKPTLPPSLARLESKEERLLHIDNEYFSLTEIIKKV
jgi:threonine synthase